LSHEKSSLELYEFLAAEDLLLKSPEYWWPDAGTFKVVIGAILTQNTTWHNVELSFKNLKNHLTLDTFVKLEEEELKVMIHPSGFYNQKAPRLLDLAKNIQNKFQGFDRFQKEVTREWLLAQKGIGEESADGILCYGCFRDEMVVDTYAKRFLKTFDITFKKNSEYKEFLEKSIRGKFQDKELPKIFAQFHGMIVEYNKLKSLK